MSDCIFCKIIRKEIPAEIVYEDENALAFLDINPTSDGHLLLISKDHHPWMTDVPDDLLAKLFITTKKLMNILKRSMGSDFVSIAVVGTDVPHFHIHLNPRTFNDSMKDAIKTKKYDNPEHMKMVGDKIRASISS